MTDDISIPDGDEPYGDEVNEGDLDRLMAELRVVGAQMDPVPMVVGAAARTAFEWRTVDAELAALTFDSWVDDRALVGVRGGGGPRQLTFEAPDFTVEIEVGAGASPRLVGQIVPASPGTVELRYEGGTLSLAVDALGRFTADRVPTGPLSLRCTGVAASPFETEWVAV